MVLSPYKIFCVGVVWFIYTIQTFFHFIKCKTNGFVHFIRLTIITLMYNSEKEFFLHLNKVNKIKYPKNLAFILNHFLIDKSKTLVTLSQFIRWILLTNQIKYFTVYDPFNIIENNEFIKILNNQINELDIKISINISYKEMKNNKIVEKHLYGTKNNDNENQFYITIIKFKDANENLIDKIVKRKNHPIYGNYPDVYKWFYDNETKVTNKNNNNLKEYEKFSTRKDEESLPELVVTFGKNKYLYYEDICLFGFPFTILENSEIINVNHKQFDQLDILDFCDIFERNSKIIKRFGS